MRCLCTDFQSKNCMRELVASTVMQKPIVALIDPDASRGGLNSDESRRQLLEAVSSYTKWHFDIESTPGGEALFDHLFASEAIEWNRARQEALQLPSNAPVAPKQTAQMT